MSVKSQLLSAWRQAQFKNYVYFSIGLNVLTALAVLIFKKEMPPIVPLFYGRAIGESQLVNLAGLLIAPGVSLFITILNLFLSSITSDLFLKKVYVITAFLISLLTTITVVKIIFLVGFF